MFLLKDKTPKRVSLTAMQQRKKRVSLKKSDTKKHSIKKVDAAIKANIVQLTSEKKLVNISNQSKPLKSLINTEKKKPPAILNKPNPSSLTLTQHKIDQNRVVFPKLDATFNAKVNQATSS